MRKLLNVINDWSRKPIRQRLHDAVITVDEDKSGVVELITEDLATLQQLHDNGEKALQQGSKYIKVERNFSVLSITTLGGKPWDFIISGHKEPEEIHDALLYEIWDLFGPLMINTSINSNVEFKLAHLRLPDFNSISGNAVTRINLLKEDEGSFIEFVKNGAIEVLRSKTIQVRGLKHYGSELERLAKEKRQAKPNILKMLLQKA